MRVEKAHDTDLHCVGWNPHNVNFILTGISVDYSIRMFDRRNLKFGGVGSPVHVFEGHDAVVLCVQWSSDMSSVFGSSLEDNILNLWDIEKV
ncbi:WD-40 repeat-containing protein MSI5-like [Impatiens glandulifera]|uniref:WD-40 repeat-containing protein MSI5-like n=1 Tax=Impatiens glandulifera TaxID=253017 RepID=UPI001FB0DD68|nr:WD-40 repeat-containing protein MSI5-like [Impatiens glandulifera]